MGGFVLRKKAREVQDTEEAQEVGVTEAGSQEEAVENVVQRETLLRAQEAKAPPQGVEGRGTVRMTLEVPRSLHTRLKLAAVRQERSIVSLVSAWIEERTVVA
jgi:predicted HicB family RNase H-like nuclease